jgi:hypothetical protein
VWQIEFVTLVFANKTIAMNVSPRKNRRGEHFDPEGLVSAVLADPKGGYVSTLMYKTYLFNPRRRRPRPYASIYQP